MHERGIPKQKVGTMRKSAKKAGVLIRVMGNSTEGPLPSDPKTVAAMYADADKKHKARQRVIRTRELNELKRNLREGFDDKPVLVATGRAGSKKPGVRSVEPWVLQRRKLTIREFRGAVKSGGFRTVHLEARGPFFFVEGEPHLEAGRGPERGIVREDSRMLLVVARGQKQRLFQNPASALELLWAMGVKNVEIHMEDWQPREAEMLNRPRPDMAERLRFAHEYLGGGADKS